MNKTIKYSINMEEFLSVAYVWQIEIEPILRQIQLKLKVSGNARLQKNWRHYDAYYLFLDKLIGKSIDCSQIKNKSVVRCMLMTANNLISFSKLWMSTRNGRDLNIANGLKMRTLMAGV